MKDKIQLKYYNYIYAHPLTAKILYVGKGSGNRSNHHLWVAKNNSSYRTNRHLTCKIKGLLKQDMEPLIAKVAWFRTDKEAYNNEILLIDKYANDGHPLCNIYKGGEGFTSEKVKSLWENPAHRTKMSELHKKRMSDPLIRESLRKTSTKYSNKAETKERVSREARERWSDPKFKEEVSKKISKGLKGNPKVSNERKKRWQNLEYREKMSLILKEKWQDPRYVEKVMAARKITMATKEYRDKMRELTRLSWQKPIRRENLKTTKNGLEP